MIIVPSIYTIKIKVWNNCGQNLEHGVGQLEEKLGRGGDGQFCEIGLDFAILSVSIIDIFLCTVQLTVMLSFRLAVCSVFFSSPVASKASLGFIRHIVLSRLRQGSHYCLKALPVKNTLTS